MIPSSSPMSPKLESLLNDTVASLRTNLGDNLHSVCLYGSAVRGNAIEGVSDLNVLIVIHDTTVAAHQAIARALEGRPQIDPFIHAKNGLPRSIRAFAPKFSSIRRNYRVLHGPDPLADMAVDPQLERFLCEQALRNFRLRLTYSFVTRQRHKNYDRFVLGHVTALFVHVSEVLRLEGHDIPKDFSARIALFERTFACDTQVLRDLLALKAAPRRLSESEALALHERLFPVVNAVVRWVEARWPA